LPASLLAAATEDPINPLVAELVFRYMRELDRVHRNVAAAFVLETLPDTPIHVIGRGWKRFREQRNPRHQFFAFEQVAHGAAQFGSNFGIFDIAPSCEALHDRCSRAMRSGTGFLISSSWKAGSAVHEDFQDLFFDGTPGRLESRVAAVRSDPDRHRSRVRAFSAMYDALIPFGAFLTAVVAEMRRRGSMLAQD
jgi:hypothetical protein